MADFSTYYLNDRPSFFNFSPCSFSLNKKRYTNIFFEQQILNQQSMRSFAPSLGFLCLILSLAQPASTLCNNPCLQCGSTSTNCTSCIAGYVPALNNICVPVTCQVPYCSICQIGSPSICLSCIPTFTLIKNTSCNCQTGLISVPYGSPAATCACNSTNCTSCAISGCLTCSSANTCSSCASGTVVTASSGCISCNMSNCQSCVVNNYCMSCKNNVSVTIDGFCQLCTTNCLVCGANSTNCAICSYGNTMLSGGTCVPCTIPFCLYCTVASTCKQCTYGYILSGMPATNGQCINNLSPPLLPFPCTTVYYNPPVLTCHYCNPTFWNYYPVNGQCMVCAVPNCMYCDLLNFTQCTTCYSNYGSTSSGQCEFYFPLNCSVQLSGTRQCMTCASFYTLINGICYPCTTAACISCLPNNTSICLVCQSGTYLSGASCLPCLPYCKICSNSTSCIILSNNAIIINSQYSYAVCTSSCLACSIQNPAACSNCKPGFYFSTYLGGGICLPCTPSSNCYNCSSTAPSQCITCLNQGVLVIVNGVTICQYCVSPCAACLIVNSTSCLSCVVGYYLVGSQCLANNCSANCAMCGSNNSCLICMSGYFPYIGNGTCLPSTAGCIKSSYLNPFTCQGCAPGTMLNQYTFVCVQCPLNCLGCISSAICVSCQPGYNLTASGIFQCVPNCILPCLTCQATNSSFCLSCIAGYTYNSNGTCSPITNCLSCVVCPIGYSFSTTQTCVACGPTCATCYGNTPSVCTSCVVGQWLNGSTCSPCSFNCASCINPNTCNYCNAGFFLSGWSLPSLSISGINSCQTCQSPCFTCSNISSLCQSCIPGYTLVGNQCQNNYNYQFNIVFNSTTTAFNNAYPSIVQALLSSINTQNQGNLFVTSYLSANSATLYAGVLSSQCFPQNTACVNTETASINSLLNSQSIGGLPITSSSMVPSNGSTTPNCQSPCSGCTIPGGNICTSCITGFTLIQGNCVSQTCPIPYCQTCAPGGICMQCLPTFYLVGGVCACQTGFAPSTTNSINAYCMCSANPNSTLSNGTCYYCSAAFCQTCSSSNLCAACFSGFTLLGNSCVFCGSTCTNCIGQGICANCTTGYNLSTNSSCVLCNVTIGCAICSSNNVCAYCLPGFTPLMTNEIITSCVACNITNCMTCNTTNICLQCNSGYTVNIDNTCVTNTIVQFNCLPPCLTCGYDNSCIQCIPDLYSVVPNNGTCFMCNVANCYICSQSTPKICSQCDQNYILVAGACVLSPYYGCQALASNGSCLFCQPYFLLLPNGTCVPCNSSLQGCSSCSIYVSYCTSCQWGLTSANGYCAPCYIFCQSCGNGCVNFNPIAIMVGNKQYLSPCYAPCLLCDPQNPTTTCTQCIGGYYLQNGTCATCLSGCFSCSSSSPAVCISCYNYQLMTANFTCVACTSPCLTCSGTQGNCTSCINSYQLVGNSCVNYSLPSTSFCFSSSAHGCAVCFSGYILINQNLNCFASGTCPGPYTCAPAMPGCQVFAPGNPYACELCDFGMSFNILTGVCIQCPLNCVNCYTDGVCYNCVAGFYLSGNSAVPCAPNCQYPCSTCSFNNASICSSCYAGYTFNQLVGTTQCLPNTQVYPPSYVCPGGYGMTVNNTCVLCTAGFNCLSCAKSFPSQCINCYIGYYLNSSLGCFACPVGCGNCTSPTTCTNCSAGYYNPQSYQTNIQVTPACLPCGFTCATCNIGPNQCLTCAPGYTLYGRQCLNNFNYYFNMSFSVNSSTFAQNYLQMVSQFQSVIEGSISSTNPRLLFITQYQSLFFVTIGGYLSSGCEQGSSCANAEQIRIQNIFSTRIIANMTFSVFFVQQVGSAPFTSSNSTSNQTNPTVFNCSLPCVACNYSVGACVSCPVGYQLINGNCMLSTCSIAYCRACLNSSSTTCVQCNPTFILNSGVCSCQQGFVPTPAGSSNAICTCVGQSCLNCTIPNCLRCNSSTVCASCASPDMLNSQGICVSCNINNCLNCASPNLCSNCTSGFSVSVSGDQCLNCSAMNCLYCSSSSSLSCAVCQPGFVLDYQNVTCITCNVPNCLSCQGMNMCYSCVPTYILTANLTCVISTCQYPCSSCSNNTCTTCVSPYQSAPASNGQCYTCNVPNCAVCGYNSPTCTSCQSGFNLINNNTQCSSSCAIIACTSCNNSQCVACSSGYTLSQGSCISCSTGCASCSSTNTTNCGSCIPGFFFNAGSCSPCQSFCSKCQSSTSCDQTQQTGQSLVQINGTVFLASCDQGCQQCSSENPTVCLQCSSGYYLNNSICVPCSLSSNCMTCSANNSANCLTCYPNTFLTVSNSINICHSCASLCVTCQQNNLNACLSCPSGYLLQNNSCLSNQCPLYCIECSSQINCLECTSGYTSVNGTCLPCLTGCSQCSSTAPGTCIQCSEGTYLDPSSQQCFGCSLSCQFCQPNGCTTCFSGYYLTFTLTCAPNCIYPCATCSITNPSNCLSCEVGYTFNPSAIQNCQIDTSCSSTFSCVSCPFGYTLTPQLQCQSCSTNCARCVVGSPSSCTSCASSQFLNNSSCVNCPSNCVSCLSSSTCTQCASGYTSINSPSANSPALCAPCTSPCQTCLSSPTSCLTCISTYFLQNAKCLSNFNFGFSVLLDTTSSQFYQNYPAFISNLSSTVEGNAGFVIITGIIAGSVNVTGFLATMAKPQTQTSNTYYNNILNSLNSNTNFAGMKVLSSQVSTNGGNAQYISSDSKSWVIIVAVVVPLVSLIIIGVGVFVYMRRNKMEENEIEMTDTAGIKMVFNE